MLSRVGNSWICQLFTLHKVHLSSWHDSWQKYGKSYCKFYGSFYKPFLMQILFCDIQI